MKFIKWIHIILLIYLSSTSYSQSKPETPLYDDSQLLLDNATKELIESAKLNYTKGNLTKAIVFSFDALNKAEGKNLPVPLFDIYTNLGNIYSTLKDFEKAYFYYKQAYNIAIELDNYELKTISFNNFSKFYYDINVIDSSEIYLNKFWLIHDTLSKVKSQHYALYNQGQLFISYGEYENAIKSYLSSVEECKKSNNIPLLLENYIALSEIYLNLEDYINAEVFINNCLHIIQNHTLLNEYSVYKLLSKLNESKGLYKESLEFHQKYINLRDTVLYSPKTKIVAKLYTTNKIHNQKDLINTLSINTSQQSKFIKKQLNIRNILITGILIIVVLLILLILNFKNKVKANRILQEQNEQIRSKNQEIKQNTEKLLKVNTELEKLNIAANQTDNAIIITNPDGEIEWLNDGYSRLYGYTLEELLKEKGNKYFESSSNQNIKEIFNKALSEKKSQIYESDVISKDGKTIRIHTTLTPVLNDDNNVIRLIAIDSDITKLKEVEKELQKLLVTKDKFFSIIAHDLKNPFNSIIGIAQLLVHGYDRLTPEKIKYFHKNLYQISKNGYELLINLLEWSRSQMGTIQFKPTEINLCALAEETFSLYSGKAIQKEITLTNSIKEDSIVHADHNMIKAILRNLISNALKFTDRGGAVEIMEKNPGEFKEITVRDTGIGIEQEDIKKLFRLDKNYTTEGTEDEIGTGLGLILCKEFIEKHQGEIRIESKVGFGSKFIFTLPFSN